MYRFPVWLRDNPQIFAKFRDKCPTADASICLNPCTDGIVQNVFNPFCLEIGAASHNTGGEVA